MGRHALERALTRSFRALFLAPTSRHNPRKKRGLFFIGAVSVQRSSSDSDSVFDFASCFCALFRAFILCLTHPLRRPLSTRFPGRSLRSARKRSESALRASDARSTCVEARRCPERQRRRMAPRACAAAAPEINAASPPLRGRACSGRPRRKAAPRPARRRRKRAMRATSPQPAPPASPANRRSD